MKEVIFRIDRIDRLAFYRHKDPNDFPFNDGYSELPSIMRNSPKGNFNRVLFLKLPVFETHQVERMGMEGPCLRKADMTEYVDDTVWEYRKEKIRETIKDLHMAWGGKFLVENHRMDKEGLSGSPLLVWEDGRVDKEAEDNFATEIFKIYQRLFEAVDKTWVAEHYPGEDPWSEELWN